MELTQLQRVDQQSHIESTWSVMENVTSPLVYLAVGRKFGPL